MVELNLPNAISITIIAVLGVVVVRWILRATGMPQII